MSKKLLLAKHIISSIYFSAVGFEQNAKKKKKILFSEYIIIDLYLT